MKTLIFLHGLGDSGAGWSFLRDLTKANVILPDAPIQSVAINMGMKMRAWYNIFGLDENAKQDHAGIKESADHIRQLLEKEISSGVEPKDIVLGGFSQGAAITLYSLRTLPFKIGGFIALSGYLPSEQQATTANLNTKVFMGHGTKDTVVHYAWGEKSKLFLESKGYQIHFKSYDVAHSATDEELKDMFNFIQ